jgi:ribosomal protein L11 methyltransferase
MKNIISWQLTRHIEKLKIPAYEDMLEILEPSIDVGRNTETGEWILNAFFDAEKNKTSIISCVEIADNILKVSGEDLAPIYEDDWYEKAKHDFPAMEIARFFLHSFDEEVPLGMVGLKIPAGLAFGTGEHPTTAGCLTLYDTAIQTNSFKNCLDMGAGSGILSMAAVKVQSTPCLAVDIDELSVETCIENLKINEVDSKVECICGDGFNTPEVSQKAPYDLIFANILMQPLLNMADDLVKTLAMGGTTILSGFLTEQEESIMENYEGLGLTQVGRFEMNNWVALSFIKR